MYILQVINNMTERLNYRQRGLDRRVKKRTASTASKREKLKPAKEPAGERPKRGSFKPLRIRTRRINKQKRPIQRATRILEDVDYAKSYDSKVLQDRSALSKINRRTIKKKNETKEETDEKTKRQVDRLYAKHIGASFDLLPPAERLNVYRSIDKIPLTSELRTALEFRVAERDNLIILRDQKKRRDLVQSLIYQPRPPAAPAAPAVPAVPTVATSLAAPIIANPPTPAAVITLYDTAYNNMVTDYAKYGTTGNVPTSAIQTASIQATKLLAVAFINTFDQSTLPQPAAAALSDLDNSSSDLKTNPDRNKVNAYIATAVKVDTFKQDLLKVVVAQPLVVGPVTGPNLQPVVTGPVLLPVVTGPAGIQPKRNVDTQEYVKDLSVLSDSLNVLNKFYESKQLVLDGKQIDYRTALVFSDGKSTGSAAQQAETKLKEADVTSATVDLRTSETALQQAYANFNSKKTTRPDIFDDFVNTLSPVDYVVQAKSMSTPRTQFTTRLGLFQRNQNQQTQNRIIDQKLAEAARQALNFQFDADALEDQRKKTQVADAAKATADLKRYTDNEKENKKNTADKKAFQATISLLTNTELKDAEDEIQDKNDEIAVLDADKNKIGEQIAKLGSKSDYVATATRESKELFKDYTVNPLLIPADIPTVDNAVWDTIRADAKKHARRPGRNTSYMNSDTTYIGELKFIYITEKTRQWDEARDDYQDDIKQKDADINTARGELPALVNERKIVEGKITALNTQIQAVPSFKFGSGAGGRIFTRKRKRCGCVLKNTHRSQRSIGCKIKLCGCPIYSK